MARTKNMILKGMSGRLGKQIVVKQYKSESVVTKYPDMSNIKLSKAQIAQRMKFKKAVRHTQSILSDPVKKAALKKKLKPGETVYHRAIKDSLST